MRPLLSRGYTRAGEYLFDSDDEAPVPKPHTAASARPLGGLSLHPPPPKQLRPSAVSAPRPSAVSAPMPKGIEKAITAYPRHYPKRGHPYHHRAPHVRLPVPVIGRISPTVHELVAPPPPVESAPKPKPAKGCNRIYWDGRDPLNEGTPWPLPKISKGFDNVGDGAPWRTIAVPQYNKKPWPMWGRGVTDLRPKVRSAMVAGRLLRHAFQAAMKMIRNTRCEHKIGMCRCPYERFFFIKSRTHGGNRGYWLCWPLPPPERGPTLWRPVSYSNSKISL